MTEDSFKTSDSALAAYLIVSGIVLEQIEKSEFPVVFNFKNPKDGTISKLMDDWEDNRAQGNIKAYYKTYRRLIREAKGKQIN